MKAAADLRALARQRLALIATARATAMGKFDRKVVASSHPIGMRQCETRDGGNRRAVARASHDVTG